MTLSKIITIIILLFIYIPTAQSQWSSDPNVNNVICDAALDQLYPKTVSDGSGGAIITWNDKRNFSSYDIYAQQVNTDGNLGVVSAVAQEPGITNNFTLLQNYPNPFNPKTKIRYSIPSIEMRRRASPQNVSLKIYDVLGKEVATLVNEEKPAGVYEVNFDASNLSSGVYIYKLQSGEFAQTKKLLLMK